MAYHFEYFDMSRTLFFIKQLLLQNRAETTYQCVLVMDGAMPFALFRDAYISSFHPKPGKHIFREEDKHLIFCSLFTIQDIIYCFETLQHCNYICLLLSFLALLFIALM